MAKAPVAGRVKTRLCPPLDPHQAAAVAQAALADTLEAVAGCGASRRVVALDGRPGPWLPPGFTVVPQRGGGLSERLAAAWSDVGAPGLQIGMDTPQITTGQLDDALARLDAVCGAPGSSTADRADRAGHASRTALLGPATDGGWWSIGFPEPAPGAFDGVVMSRPDTGRLQADRLRRLGWDVEGLDQLRDIDEIDDLLAVAAGLPGSRTAAAVAALDLELAGAAARAGAANLAGAAGAADLAGSAATSATGLR